jgi:hypothetical protein
MKAQAKALKQRRKARKRFSWTIRAADRRALRVRVAADCNCNCHK